MTRTDGAAQRPIVEVARDLDIAEEFLEPYGRDKAKIRLEAIAASGRKPGKLILVSAITPTPAGEGKTTTSIGLSQGLSASASARPWRCGSRRWGRSSAARAGRPVAA